MALPKEDKRRVSLAMFAALMERDQTFSELWPHANLALAYRRADQDAPGYRAADAWLQASKRKGYVTGSRQHGFFVWTLTPDGKRHFMGEDEQ